MRASLVVLTYNQGPLAVEAVRSALRQRHRDLEVIVTSDGGDPATRQAVRRECERASESLPLRLIAPGRNRGPAWCIRSALDACTGDLVCFLDGDDVWADDMLDCQSESLSECHGSVPGVVGLAGSMTETGEILEREAFTPHQSTLQHQFIVRHGARFSPLAAAFRRDALESIPALPETHLVCDYHIAAHITEHHSLVPSSCHAGYEREWPRSLRREGRHGARMTVDRLEILESFLTSPDPRIREAARRREKELLNHLLVRPVARSATGSGDIAGTRPRPYAPRLQRFERRSPGACRVHSPQTTRYRKPHRCSDSWSRGLVGVAQVISPGSSQRPGSPVDTRTGSPADTTPGIPMAPTVTRSSSVTPSPDARPHRHNPVRSRPSNPRCGGQDRNAALLRSPGCALPLPDLRVGSRPPGLGAEAGNREGSRPKLPMTGRTAPTAGSARTPVSSRALTAHNSSTSPRDRRHADSGGQVAEGVKPRQVSRGPCRGNGR